MYLPLISVPVEQNKTATVYLSEFLFRPQKFNSTVLTDTCVALRVEQNMYFSDISLSVNSQHWHSSKDTTLGMEEK